MQSTGFNAGCRLRRSRAPCLEGLEEGKVVPPRISQHSQGTEGRVLDIHLHGAPHPQGGNRGRGLHYVEVAMLVP